MLAGHLLESLAACILCGSDINWFALLALWQGVDESISFGQDFSLIIDLREGAPLHIARITFQVLVNTFSIVIEVVDASLALYALVAS